MKKCPYCAEEIQDEAVVCRYCQRALTPTTVVAPAVAAWSPGTAAVLSFFIPGLGQIYKGQLGTGFLFFVGAIAGYVMLIVPGLIVHLFAILNAYNAQPRIPGASAPAERPELTQAREEFLRRTPERLAAEKKRNRIAAGALIVFAVVAVIASFTQQPQRHVTTTRTQAEPAIVSGLIARPDGNEAQSFIDRFGAPDSDTSSETERPRPAIVTRILTYRAQRVRAIYRADVVVASRERVGGRWKLIGYTDPVTNESITRDVALQRMVGGAK